MTDAVTQIFRTLDRELWVITARADGVASGLISTSVTQAFIDVERPRIIVGLAVHHLTQSLVASSGVFAAHLLCPDQADWVQHFGTRSGRDFEKFEGWNQALSELGAPLLRDAPAWLECRVEDVLQSGDRCWYLAEVVDGKLSEGLSPLTFHQYFATVDEELKALLKMQLEQDSLVDRQLVDEWRTRRSSTDAESSGSSSK